MSIQEKFGSRIARWEISYYDIVLFALPVVLLVGAVAEVLLPVPSHAGITAAGIVSALVLGDAMFNRPPSGRSV